MNKNVLVGLSWWARVLRRQIVSNWFLLVVFLGLGIYIVFPGPLDQVSFVLWPAEAGTIPSARVSFTVSGATSFPGAVSLNIEVTNVDIINHDFAILAVIGSLATSEWYGPGWYRDNLVPSSDVQNISDPWYVNAFICSGSLRPGQSFNVTRKIELVNNPRVTDAVVILYNKYDASTELARSMKLNVINQ